MEEGSPDRPIDPHSLVPWVARTQNFPIPKIAQNASCTFLCSYKPSRELLLWHLSVVQLSTKRVIHVSQNLSNLDNQRVIVISIGRIHLDSKVGHKTLSKRISLEGRYRASAQKGSRVHNSGFFVNRFF